MVFHSETRLSCIRTAAVLLLGTATFAFSQQFNLQTSLLPATPLSAVSTENNARSKAAEAQRLATEVTQLRSAAESVMADAEKRFQAGKKLYQEKATDAARKQFDAAVDLMLDASEMAADRQVWETRFDAMIDAIHRLDMAGLGVATPAEAAFEKAPLEDLLQMTFPTDPKLKLKVREQLMATASQLPLVLNDQVLGYIRYFSSTRGRATMLAGLRRAGKYRPLIRRILDEEGVPQEFIHLAQAESGFLPRAISRMAAGGMWQFVRDRGRQYGLTQDRYIDERFDPEKATRAAARHLRDLYAEFGDWYLAIAAYNCGPGNVAKAVERSGYADFWELRARRLLPLETTNYVPIILAMTIMTKNAEAYGLTEVEPEEPLEYDSIPVIARTSLALVSDLIDAPVSELMALNPGLLKNVVPEGASLRVPKGAGAGLVTALQMVPEERRASWRIHKVESGETLSAIGKRYGAAAGMIAAANEIASEDLEPGARLLIPAVERAESGKSLRPRTSRSAKSSRSTASRHPANGSRARRVSMAHPAPASLTQTAFVRRPASFN